MRVFYLATILLQFQRVSKNTSLIKNTITDFGLNYSNKYLSSEKMSPQIAGYGTWKSPITSELLAKGEVKLSNDLGVDQEGRVFWIEIRSEEGGRSVICSKKPGESLIERWTSKDFNARTRANEYGGGAFFIGPDGVYFSNFNDQRLYRQTKHNASPEAITSESSGFVSYADGQYALAIKKIVSVKEDHKEVKKGNEEESQNSIISLDPETKIETALVSGADFYSSPRVSENGKYLTWCQWNHPNMPWDTTEIWIGELNSDGTALVKNSLTKVAGVENNSVILPSWSPDNELFFIDDKSNWWNLYQYNFETKAAVNILPKEAEIGGPQWIFGIDGYAFCKNKTSNVYMTYHNELGCYNTKNKTYEVVPINKLMPAGSGADMGGITPINSLVSSPDGSLYLIAAGPTKAPTLIRVHHKDATIEIIKETLSIDIDVGYISVPETVSFPTSDNGIAHAYLYMPKNKDYIPTEGQLPPLMVRVHGGPTSAVLNTLNLKHQYLTSRGIAVLDVNYRGSTGYGRTYRDSLKLKWGIYDIDDVCYGANFLVEQNKVDGKRLCIDGGSAGGYTTLAALTFKKVFHAGISNYGVSDLEALTKDTHKFESRYLDSMIGPYPEAKSIYIERSPIHNTEKLDTPMAFFQGGDDKVVPPIQAEQMFEVVKKKGLPTAYVLFPEEQHGFRAAKNIQKAIDGELYFLSKVFGFEAADLQVEMEIFNLK